jgi:two-component system sensor histidine kinase PilS (NtrC family)
MTPLAVTFVAMTALVAGLLGLLAIAWIRLRAAALQGGRRGSDGGSDSVLLSGALQEALTRVKAQEQAMSARAAASEQLSAQVFESLTAGLLLVNAERRVQIVNPAARRMLGISASGTGTIYTELLRQSEPLLALIEEGLRTQAAIVRRTVHLQRHDRSWHLGVTISPFRAAASGPGVICLFSDVTAIVELEEQLQLKEALARLGELTGGIAHEFRNGLSTLHGYSRLMSPEHLPSAYRPYLDGIRQETEALGAIVTNFLAYARPETVTWAAVDLEAAARHAADDVRQELPDGAMVDVCGTFAVVHGDEILMRQLFANLIRNAAEACAGTGRTPAIVVRGDLRGASDVRVRVEDNGPGIAEADRARVFTPFFTTRARGSGLGLAIVQKIALLHNGRVSVGTSVAGGARLEIVFPVSAGDADAIEPTAAAVTNA